MKTIEYNTFDKSKSLNEEWKKEPDKKQWLDKNTGFPCIIRRSGGGAWCGYVGVSKDHPYFEKHYDSIDYDSIQVHWGLTFSGACQKNADPKSDICHVVEEGEDDNVW